MFFARLLWHRLAGTLNPKTRKGLAIQSLRLQKQTREGEILLGWRCWERLEHEDEFAEPYWNLRESLLDYEEKHRELAETERVLDFLDRQMVADTAREEEVDQQPAGALPPRKDGRLNDTSTVRETAPAQHPTPTAAQAEAELREERRHAQELQRRFKLVQTRLRVLLRERANETKMAEMRDELARLRQDYESSREKLAFLDKQVGHHHSIPHRTETDLRGQDKPNLVKPSTAESLPAKTRDVEKDSPAPLNPNSSPGSDVRRRRTMVRSRREQLVTQLLQIERVREDYLRQIGSRLRRLTEPKGELRQLVTENRAILRRLTELGVEAGKIERLQRALR